MGKRVISATSGNPRPSRFLRNAQRKYWAIFSIYSQRNLSFWHLNQFLAIRVKFSHLRCREFGCSRETKAAFPEVKLLPWNGLQIRLITPSWSYGTYSLGKTLQCNHELQKKGRKLRNIDNLTNFGGQSCKKRSLRCAYTPFDANVHKTESYEGK